MDKISAPRPAPAPSPIPSPPHPRPGSAGRPRRPDGRIPVPGRHPAGDCGAGRRAARARPRDRHPRHRIQGEGGRGGGGVGWLGWCAWRGERGRSGKEWRAGRDGCGGRSECAVVSEGEEGEVRSPRLAPNHLSAPPHPIPQSVSVLLRGPALRRVVGRRPLRGGGRRGRYRLRVRPVRALRPGLGGRGGVLGGGGGVRSIRRRRGRGRWGQRLRRHRRPPGRGDLPHRRGLSGLRRCPARRGRARP